MPATQERLLLAESVALVIEVKSDLSAQWDQIRHTVRRVKELTRQMNVVMTIGDGPSATIPCVAVGYTGHATVDGLLQRLETTPERDRPDGALVIESGCFVWPGMSAWGPIGLYGLCMAINVLLSQIGFAAPDLSSYARE